jgi:flavin-binding protein dodecin
MSDNHTYKMIEIVGSSPQSSDAAISNALAECSKTLHHLDWFEVVSTRGHIVDGKVAHFQVTLKIGMRIVTD